MRIKRITLFNIGPYLNENKFDFSTEKGRNIVLIGGKNGAGKTTFFKAIKTCLYGCKVWGFDAAGKEYMNIINGLVNSKSMYDSTAKAYVEIELEFDDGKQVNRYVLHREWQKVKNSLSEFFHIRKNNELIIGGEEDDFTNYLLSIIPPDMFNFYFFDGESIADFFLGADGNKNFRNAFLKLYGLDTLSIMIENFSRSIKRTGNGLSSYDVYTVAKKKLSGCEEATERISAEIKETEGKIDLLQVKVCSLQETYEKEGGIGLATWKEINVEIAKEEVNRENINRWLKEIANHYLPFIILEKQLHVLLDDINAFQEKRKCEVLLSTFSSDEFKKSITDYFVRIEGQHINENGFIDFLKEQLYDGESTIEFELTDGQVNRLIAQIYEKWEFDKKSIKKAISQLNASLKKTKKLRDQMMSSSIEGYEALMDEKNAIEKEISSLTIILEEKRVALEKAREEEAIALIEFNKAKEAYEFSLKNKSISDMSERAVATYSLLEEQLVLRQAKLLQQEFISCFSSIINKDNFVDGIIIDKKINVIPYKYIKVTRSQMSNYYQTNKEFLSMFDNVQFIMDMNRLEFGEVESIMLPAPIKSPFSQGERQVYIMSLYLALLKTSHKDIPFFIDTPFARIDSNHRASIVREFFVKIKNQLFVLSTDEEIVGEYERSIDDKVSNKFLLQINEYGLTKVISNMYFGGQK